MLRRTAVNNTAQNSSDNLPSYAPDNHHSSDVDGRGGDAMVPVLYEDFTSLRQGSNMKTVENAQHTAGTIFAQDSSS